MKRWASLVGLMSLFMVIALTGCQSTYYDAMGYVGVDKREILTDRAASAREAQQEASDKLARTLELFHAVVEGPASERSAKFSQLQTAYQNAQRAADRLTQRNDALKSVADALFDAWDAALLQEADEDRRFQRAEEIERSHVLYTDMIAATREAQRHMDPLLLGIRNDLLSMSDDIGGDEIAGYASEVKRLDIDINQQRQRMQTAIERAEAFTSALPEGDGQSW